VLLLCVFIDLRTLSVDLTFCLPYFGFFGKKGVFFGFLKFKKIHFLELNWNLGGLTFMFCIDLRHFKTVLALDDGCWTSDGCWTTYDLADHIASLATH
jgi:hypothetical protein